MKKKQIVMLLFITLSIFFANCKTISSYIVEDKKILVLGNVIGISGERIENKKNNDIIKTSIKNIGIMTGIDLDTNRFAAFGHSLDLNNNIKESKCYEAKCFSVDKSKNGDIGKLNANTIVNEQIGNVTENTNKGVFGKILDISNYTDIDSKELYLASKYEVKKGDAKIYINLDGKGITEYDIIIDYIDYFSETKNIHIKVIDNRLLEKTGGIVKGMSGTPIIQNNKLVGAVNSTLESNVTEAYGIFADELF